MEFKGVFYKFDRKCKLGELFAIKPPNFPIRVFHSLLSSYFEKTQTFV